MPKKSPPKIFHWHFTACFVFVLICQLFATFLLLTCGGLAVLGFVGFFIYKLCKKGREEEEADMDYSVAVTNSMFREERSNTSFCVILWLIVVLYFYLFRIPNFSCTKAEWVWVSKAANNRDSLQGISSLSIIMPFSFACHPLLDNIKFLGDSLILNRFKEFVVSVFLYATQLDTHQYFLCVLTPPDLILLIKWVGYNFKLVQLWGFKTCFSLV